MNNEEIVLFWFRRDLRIQDNTGFFKALEGKCKVLPLFIFDDNITKELEKNDPRIQFIHERLNILQQQFKSFNSLILCLQGDPVTLIDSLTSEYNVSSVYANKDYEPYAIERDLKIEILLQKKTIQFCRFKDQLVFEESEILKENGEPYTVFTPFKNKWMQRFIQLDPFILIKPDLNNLIKTEGTLPSLTSLGFVPSRIKVLPFDLDVTTEYEKNRDYPSIDKTSYLSPHLRFGTVSIREIIDQVKDHQSFLNELIWREFFMQILFHFPKVVHRNFKQKYDAINWRNDPDEFEKWSLGQTGYPMVDAGMRQLNETGYMHNRVRMIAAGFLCKHLLTDWRFGEAYFAKKLLDYELASNNGNWQWAAGTGCDAAPYFRIFNPETQLAKFDKNHNYVKKWIPELGTSKYPSPIIDHKIARKRALDAYQQALKPE